MELTGYEKSLDQYTKNELIQIAKKYYVTYKSPSGQTSTAYTKLSNSELIEIIKKDSDYIRSNPKLGLKPSRGRRQNRITPLLKRYNGTENPDELMVAILEAIKDTNVGNIPIPGKFYTFRYYAKTPRITYDKHPLIRAGEILSRGFVGLNAHWGEYRRYNTSDGERLIGGLHEVTMEEFNSLLYLSYAKFIRNY
jgi:hypothetical protein